MRSLLTLLKKVLFWNYARNTWQWDVLCAVILVFIFLTPKAWWEIGERRAVQAHQSPVVKTVILTPEIANLAGDEDRIEQQVRDIIGRSDVKVVAVRRVVDPGGKIQRVEVDIR